MQVHKSFWRFMGKLADRHLYYLTWPHQELLSISRANVFSIKFYACLLLFAFASCQTREAPVNQKPFREELGKSLSDSLLGLEADMIAQYASQSVMLAEPEKGEWRYEHHEASQSILAFASSHPRLIKKPTIYLLPIGQRSQQQDSIYHMASSFLTNFFEFEAQQLPQLSLKELSDTIFASGKLNSSVLVNDILLKHQKDSFSIIVAITALPITPSSMASSVFGQASLANKTCVVSLAELGKFRNGKPNFKFELQRSLKVMVHEISHSIGLKHCQTYSCIMNGINHLHELDKTPLKFCPLCLAKLKWRLALGRNSSAHEEFH